jgi:hypothetical protein
VDAGAAISRFKCWWAHDEDLPFTIYLQSSGVAGERELSYLPWDDFRWMYRRGTQTDGIPSHVSVDPSDNLVIGPKPNAIFVINGEFQRGAQILAADADIPEMPTDFHMLIVYEAMKKYAGFEGAPEVYDRGNEQGRVLMRQLEQNQRPQVRLAPPLV